MFSLLGCAGPQEKIAYQAWRIDASGEWEAAAAQTAGLRIVGDEVHLEGASGAYRSILKPIPSGQRSFSVTVAQSPVWQNWTAVGKVAPQNLLDAPIFLAMGEGNYWLFGRYDGKRKADFKAEPAQLDGFDAPLKTTPYAHQFDAPGGLRESLGGYHAWQTRDMVNWVHHGPVTDFRGRWATTAEMVDGKAYIYYDHPNDQDPHLVIDEDLTDGHPGQDMGMVFEDPSDGSDIAILRDARGQFHIFYEDWSPIDASQHSWDSPLAGHAVSATGKGGFEILQPAVDERTEPTGRFARFPHPHWYRDDPDNFRGEVLDADWPGLRWATQGKTFAFSEYEIHEPEQDAYGDWAAISIGEQHYLFGDFHPAGTHERADMKIAWFTSADLDAPFVFCDAIGSGHPDIDVGFAKGQFYLINQTDQDYISPGPWVDSVELRIGLDTSGDGAVDYWTDWQPVRESYAPLPGFAKQVHREAATADFSDLPAAVAYCFELRLEDTTANKSTPILDSVVVRLVD